MVSLGCPKNRVDTERILAVMTGSGFEYTEDPAAAAIMIVNTCAFIEPAVEESIDVILNHKAENPRGLMVVAGCLPLRYRESLQEPLPEVDLFLTPDRIGELPQTLARLMSRGTGRGAKARSSAGPVAKAAQQPSAREASPGFGPSDRILTTSGYAYLKIAEGCHRRCRYCAIPSIRGPLISRDPEDLEREARFLASSGVRELVLVAQDLTAYGQDRKDRNALTDLLARLSRVEGVKWIRLMYLYPEGIKSDLIRLIRDTENILPYMDIPFQHVADSVLRAMGRPGKGDRIRKLVERLRKEIPGLTLRTTLMVGYPGEGDKEFEELLEFVRSFAIERVGVFTYSPEEGTPAMRLGDPVPPDVKHARADQIRALHASFTEKRNRKRRGSVEQALVEGVSLESELLLQGRTWDQAPDVDGVLYVTSGDAIAGETHTIKITDSHGPDLFGEIV